jgi:predicted  nucleic acid-binding Zn-ribbon protein
LDSWASFANLGQLPSWKQNVAEYHTGIKPNSYYKTSAEVERLKKQADEIFNQLRVLESARDKIKKELTTDTFSLDLGSFKREVAQLLLECDKLNKIEQEYKAKLIDLRNQRRIILYQIKATEGAIRESRLDYKFAVDELNEDEVHCPTCDAVYQNSFAERFAIADDEGRARDMLTQLRGDENDISQDLQDLEDKYQTTRIELSRLTEILETKKQNIQLSDVIQSEGKREVERAFLEHIAQFQKSLDEILGRLQRGEEELKALKKELKDLKVQIVNFYLQDMNMYLHKLDVHTLKESSYKTIYGRISETGSDQPRALLAYYFSILDTIKKFSPTTFCPIVIDSPNQQAQDRESLKKMISFIFEQLPQDSQLVLGVEDLAGIEPVGTVVELTTKLKVLERTQYEETRAALQPLLDSVYESTKVEG